MNNILVDFGFFQITYYAVIVLIGIFVGGTLVIKEAQKFKLNLDLISNLIFWMIIFGLIGARLYFVFFHWDYYQDNLVEIFKVWEGGLAIHGGLLFGILILLIYAKKYKVNVFRLTDIIVVGLIIGQSIGRWGNFFNQEAYGAIVSRDFLTKLHLPNFIVEGMNIYGIYYHPTFLYESLWCLVGFIILLFIRKNKYLKLGQLTGAYLMWYSFGRFFIEGLRLDSLMFSQFKIAQIVSGLLFIIGLIIIVERGKGSRFENLYIEGEKTDAVKF